jgi:hypothetical protein
MALEPNAIADMMFQELIMAEGCRNYETMRRRKKDEQGRMCCSLRRDNHLVNAANERAFLPEGNVVERGLVPLDDIGRNRASGQ